MSAHAWLVRLLPLLGALLTLALIAYPALGRDLWIDEAYTLSYTSHPDLGALLEDVRKNEETPPLYFVSVWAWSRAFGRGEAAVRALSVIYSGAAVALFAVFVRRRMALPDATVAVAALAMAPMLQIYALEARAYAMTLLMSLLCMWAFEWLLRTPERPAARLGYGLSAGALFLTSYFGAALLAAHWLIWLWRLRSPGQRRQRIVAWVIAQALAAACMLPWLPSLYEQFTLGSQMTIPSHGDWQDYYLLMLSALMGIIWRQPWAALWLLTASAGVILAAIGLLGSRRQDKGLGLRMLGLHVVVMIAMMVLLEVSAARYTLALLPGFAVALGAGFSTARRRWPALAPALLALTLAGMAISRALGSPFPADKPWTATAALITERADPAGDVVALASPSDQRVFAYYYAGPQLDILGAHHFDEFYVYQGHDISRPWTTETLAPLLAEYRRVWWIEEQFYSRGLTLDLPYRELGRWQLGRIAVTLYEVAAP